MTNAEDADPVMADLEIENSAKAVEVAVEGEMAVTEVDLDKIPVAAVKGMGSNAQDGVGFLSPEAIDPKGALELSHRVLRAATPKNF